MSWQSGDVQGVDFHTPETTKPSYFYEGFVLYGAGTRRTVAVSGARFSAGLEFGGKFGVPQLVTINKSASYGFRWSRTRDFLKCQHVVRLLVNYLKPHTQW